MAKTRRQKKRRGKTIEEARHELRWLSKFLAQEARLAVLPDDKQRFRGAAVALRAFLMGRRPSLDHAFGLVPGRGNPRRAETWAAREAIVNRKKLSAGAAADEFKLADQRSVRKGLKRGRELNRLAAQKVISEEISARQDLMWKAYEAGRAADVKQHNRKHRIRTKR